jgi:plasmid replication initiation protein
MNIGEQIEIVTARDYKVVKSNYLVQKSRYDLTFAEQRALAYIISMIKPTIATPATEGVPYQLMYEFDIAKYAKICGLHSDGGMLYQETKKQLKNLMLKVLYLEAHNGDEIMATWLTAVWYNEKSGRLAVEINKYLVPHLFDLQEKYTAYDLLNILAFSSQYSIRIYEILQSHAYQKSVVFGVEELKKRLMVDDVKAYGRFNNVKQRIIEPALAEINKYTNLNVSYETATKGRKVVKVQFLVSKKPAFDRFMAQTSASGEIEGPPNGGQGR